MRPGRMSQSALVRAFIVAMFRHGLNEMQIMSILMDVGYTEDGARTLIGRAKAHVGKPLGKYASEVDMEILALLQETRKDVRLLLEALNKQAETIAEIARVILPEPDVG